MGELLTFPTDNFCVPTSPSFFDLCAERRSMRGYLPTPVAPEVLEQLLVCARKAPSGANLQPGSFTWVKGAAREASRAAPLTHVNEPGCKFAPLGALRAHTKSCSSTSGATGVGKYPRIERRSAHRSKKEGDVGTQKLSVGKVSNSPMATLSRMQILT